MADMVEVGAEMRKLKLWCEVRSVEMGEKTLMYDAFLT